LKSSTPVPEKKIHSGEIAIDSLVTHLVKSIVYTLVMDTIAVLSGFIGAKAF